MKYGPNVRALISAKAAELLIPHGAVVSSDAFREALTVERIEDATRDATAFAELAIDVVRTNAGNDQADDEALARAVLQVRYGSPAAGL